MKPIVFGLASTRASDAELAFFAEQQPAGFILFGRNIETLQQLQSLVAALRASVDHTPLVMIDQEGGRVQRLTAPCWDALPPVGYYETVYDNTLAQRLITAHSLVIAAQLAGVGINMSCYPVLDIPIAGSHTVIGDRAFSSDPRRVGMFGKIAADALIKGGVLPIIKHMPGHGRAMVDSHKELPTVHDDRATLIATDFEPFKVCADAPFAMTAHIAYSAYDPDNPATQSPIMVEDVMRGEIGFKGLIISDDIGMHALGGPIGDRALKSLASGIDLLLHCSGDMLEMQEVASVTPRASHKLRTRVAEALELIKDTEIPDTATLLAELEPHIAAASSQATIDPTDYAESDSGAVSGADSDIEARAESA